MSKKRIIIDDMDIGTYKWWEWFIAKILGKKHKKGVYIYQNRYYICRKLMMAEMEKDIEENV